MKYELRTLMYTDIMPMFRILDKIGFKDLKEKVSPEMFQSDDTTNIGFSFMMSIGEVILDNAEKCEEDLIEFIASVAQTTPDDVRSLTLVEFAELFVAILQKDDFKDFFKVVSESFQMK